METEEEAKETEDFLTLQNFEVEYKAKKEARKQKGGPGGVPRGAESKTDSSATPPPAKQRHPGDESRPRGFERGLLTISN